MSSPNRNKQPAGGAGGSGSGPPPAKKSTVSATKSSTSSNPVRKAPERKPAAAGTANHEETAKRRVAPAGGSVNPAATAASPRATHSLANAKPSGVGTTGAPTHGTHATKPAAAPPITTANTAPAGNTGMSANAKPTPTTHTGNTGTPANAKSAAAAPTTHTGNTGTPANAKPAAAAPTTPTTHTGNTGTPANAKPAAAAPTRPTTPSGSTGTPANVKPAAVDATNAAPGIPAKTAASAHPSGNTAAIPADTKPAAANLAPGIPAKPAASAHPPGNTGIPANKPPAPVTFKRVPQGVTSHLQDVLKVTEAKDAREKATNIRNALKAEFDKPTKNLAVLDDLLEAGKVILVKLFSPVATKVNEEDAILARDILEYGAKISVYKKSELGLIQFEAYVCQLKHYYLDLKNVLKTPSESMYEILGMYLMYLLSRNLISTFHVELETFIHPDVRAVLSNVYIKKAVEIEQYLTDGRFNKILALHLASEDDLKKEGLNSMGFKFFIDRIFEYSREIIADVMESSADSISASKAQSKLHIQDPQALILYCKKRDWEHKKDGQDRICFKRANVDGRTLPAMQLAQDALFYAKELDTIV